jgi:hypothetical protein
MEDQIYMLLTIRTQNDNLLACSVAFTARPESEYTFPTVFPRGIHLQDTLRPPFISRPYRFCVEVDVEYAGAVVTVGIDEIVRSREEVLARLADLKKMVQGKSPNGAAVMVRDDCLGHAVPQGNACLWEQAICLEIDHEEEVGRKGPAKCVRTEGMEGLAAKLGGHVG